MNPEGGKVGARSRGQPADRSRQRLSARIRRCTPWVNDFIEECAAFPNGAHDDQVDAMTQALLRWHTAVPEVQLVPFCEWVHISPV